MSRRLGQHFLFDPRILERIVDALGPEPGETVLEIGPGRGTLTAALLPRAGRLVVIEKDHRLTTLIRERFPEVEVVEGDALDLDWHALAGPGPFSICGNIPYNITSPLIDQALRPPMPRRIVFLVQKEVALRLGAQPGNGDYGALSVGVQALAHVERLFTVGAGSFSPPPRVDSAVVRLSPRSEPLIPPDLTGSFRRLVVGLFGFRRKQLGRGLRELTGWDAGLARGMLERIGLTPEARPETLTPSEFVRLHAALVDGGWQAQ
ncbi:MAG: 16S rRNA (adenine(1518)-N(6)/adenine(1519)-N(6))-dimethyltransferase RsmA [Gemmatimonadales bacterium]